MGTGLAAARVGTRTIRTCSRAGKNSFFTLVVYWESPTRHAKGRLKNNYAISSASHSAGRPPAGRRTASMTRSDADCISSAVFRGVATKWGGGWPPRLPPAESRAVEKRVVILESALRRGGETQRGGVTSGQLLRSHCSSPGAMSSGA